MIWIVWMIEHDDLLIVALIALVMICSALDVRWTDG